MEFLLYKPRRQTVRSKFSSLEQCAEFSSQQCWLTYPTHHDSKTFGTISGAELLDTKTKHFDQHPRLHVTVRTEIFLKSNLTPKGAPPKGAQQYNTIVQRSVFPTISFSIDLFTCFQTRISTPSRAWHHWMWKMSRVSQIVYFHNSQFGIFTWCSSVGL